MCRLCVQYPIVLLASYFCFATPVMADDPVITGGAGRSAYFGDLHLHTRYSNDAFFLVTDAGLDEAYRYAKGEPVLRGSSQTIQLKTPLDFLAVTEHAKFLGALESFTDPNHPLFDHPELGRLLRSAESDVRMQGWYAFLKAIKDGESLDGYDEDALKSEVWAAIVDAADRHNEPGTFTTFAAYEWSGSVEGIGLHRNVIFKDTEHLESPFTSNDSNLPEDLWSYLESAYKNGVVALAIPHNPNTSDGRMFTDLDTRGMPIDKAYANRRGHHEPLVEITQNKGTSETHPKLAPYDSFADFEIYPNGKVEGSYAREGLLLGVDVESRDGFNPLMFGFVGSTDSHAAYSFVEEDNASGFAGANYDSKVESRWGRQLWNGLPYYALSAGGLTGVWADANTREDIFAAFKRRETYATSGTRLRVRAFAGWDYTSELLQQPDWVEQAYARGVPMGSVLSRPSVEQQAPRLLAWAEKEPGGANLDRIQVIKGWSEKGEQRVRIYDVAVSDGRVVAEDGQVEAVGSTVNVENASYTNDIGAAELKAVWIDPDFDHEAAAFYYVRVLEIPTPRWSTYDAHALQVEIPEGMPASIQERAFASPIWYEPRP